ncbi:Lrp/AsnC family transcriptional regulator of ectoine degradation [Roseibium hamelinense]|uniref:Lrp/AsnC family transcriptional regulator of ectoine degradation n=1 Tax=Roseibium hamelinense TaxID=150831 RepID=A0A562SNU7_9HYPH|nr:Lrp/AsnC family transcriptional regulator [Roseibium hamelinense]MTI45099.1 Lrp/AsnC family transcriptional regulator [Roseibium hamelinense]TWI82366.1 Lrp/AsnC family transcriptional regulator of ectoine degradation [Roseibium hamelinense]
MIKLDDRDLKILSVLQKEGRIAKTALAARVNLSPTPCWERLKRMENAGVIEAYCAQIAPNAFGPLSIVFMQAELSSHMAEDFDRFERAIADIEEIVECWAVGGGFDYLLKFACRDINAYQRCVDDLLMQNIGLNRYFTYVVTKGVKLLPIPPVPRNSSVSG